MENLKTNKAARAAAMLLVLVLITMCILSGTLAKYITKDSGSDSARVAKFGVIASISGNLFGNAYKCDYNGTTVTAHDKFAIAKYGDDTHTGTADEGFAVRAETKSAKIVAPGTYNDKGMTISLKGKPEVATKLEPALTTEDIVLKEGTYGVMVPVAVDAINPDDYASYYKKSSIYYSKCTSLPTSGDVYKLQNMAVVEEDYYPLNWSLTGSTVASVTNGRLADVTSNIKAKFYEMSNNPNYDYTGNVGTATITWAWPWANDYDTAVKPGTSTKDPSYSRDAKDTILADLIASPMDNGQVVVEKDGEYISLTVSNKVAKLWQIQYANLGANVDASLTVKQGCTGTPEGATPIGGKIFYVNDTATGGEYHFYDAAGHEITGDQTVANLANAKYYKVTAGASKDKFYVMGTDEAGSAIVVKNNTWGKEIATGVKTDTVGAGKGNTASLSVYDGTIFQVIEDMTANGNDDWFVGTQAELKLLQTSGVAGTLFNNYIWTSVEANKSSAVAWSGTGFNHWSSGTGKTQSNYTYVGVALRAF